MNEHYTHTYNLKSFEANCKNENNIDALVLGIKNSDMYEYYIRENDRWKFISYIDISTLKKFSSPPIALEDIGEVSE